jgi:hypothetical protein
MVKLQSNELIDLEEAFDLKEVMKEINSDDNDLSLSDSLSDSLNLLTSKEEKTDSNTYVIKLSNCTTTNDIPIVSYWILTYGAMCLVNCGFIFTNPNIINDFGELINLSLGSTEFHVQNVLGDFKSYWKAIYNLNPKFFDDLDFCHIDKRLIKTNSVIIPNFVDREINNFKYNVMCTNQMSFVNIDNQSKYKIIIDSKSFLDFIIFDDSVFVDNVENTSKYFVNETCKSGTTFLFTALYKFLDEFEVNFPIKIIEGIKFKFLSSINKSNEVLVPASLIKLIEKNEYYYECYGFIPSFTTSSLSPVDSYKDLIKKYVVEYVLENKKYKETIKEVVTKYYLPKKEEISSNKLLYFIFNQVMSDEYLNLLIPSLFVIDVDEWKERLDCAKKE